MLNYSSLTVHIKKKPMRTLRLVLSDQLTPELASLRDLDKQHDIVMLCETLEEATYVKHHKQKLVFQWASMRHFAADLTRQGVKVHYVKWDEHSCASLDEAVQQALQLFKVDAIALTFPGEYRLLEKFLAWQQRLDIDISILEDDRFLCSPAEFASWAKTRKILRMEYFYHHMRVKENVLLDEKKKPLGGQWNFDKENRKPLGAKVKLPLRASASIDSVTKEVMALVEKHFPKHFGSLQTFRWAVTREAALTCLAEFIKKELPHFGDYQDAMSTDNPFLFHSLLSPYLNAGLLLPKEVITLAEEAYQKGLAPLNAVEGFIRQILGWREYVRGVYWLKMPNYAKLNFLNAKRHLPAFYWTADTSYHCLQQVITQTQEYAYAHHIQRLMVTGNFALLAGFDPKEVCEWYLIVYADAYDWVELPNTLAMSLFADGGILGSKPYAASGKYIQRMSNYCDSCQFNPQDTIGEKACPFNSLYWHFLHRNQKQLQGNQRLTYTYATWNKMAAAKQQAILQKAQAVLLALEEEAKKPY